MREIWPKNQKGAKLSRKLKAMRVVHVPGGGCV